MTFKRTRVGKSSHPPVKRPLQQTCNYHSGLESSATGTLYLPLLLTHANCHAEPIRLGSGLGLSQEKIRREYTSARIDAAASRLSPMYGFHDENHLVQTASAFGPGFTSR